MSQFFLKLFIILLPMINPNLRESCLYLDNSRVQYKRDMRYVLEFHYSSIQLQIFFPFSFILVLEFAIVTGGYSDHSTDI